MKDKLNTLGEIVDFQVNGDNSKGIAHLDLLTNSLFKLTQSLYDYKEKPAYHLRELEGKYFRFGLANHSILRLVMGNQFKIINKEVLIPDIFSFKSLTRMQIESYLIMYYLFYDNISDEEKSLSYDIYKIHALQKQLNFKVNFDTSFTRDQRLKISNELRQAIDSVKESSFFKTANLKEQKEYLNPRYPKLVGSKDLFELSGLSKVGINQMWQLYSNYAHAEHISDRQYNTSYNIRKSFSEDISLIITINLVLTSKLIVKISELFDGAKIEYDKLELNEKVIIETWNNLNK